MILKKYKTFSVLIYSKLYQHKWKLETREIVLTELEWWKIFRVDIELYQHGSEPISVQNLHVKVDFGGRGTPYFSPIDLTHSDVM